MRLFRIHTETRPNIAAIVSERFDGFTLYAATGYWRGLREDSTTVEILADASRRADVDAIADRIRTENGQQAVLVVELDATADLFTATGKIRL